jgi:hypothetical protein
MCFEPKTQLSAGCGTIKTAICPSAVDACPSAPGGCFDPGIPINPIRLRISALERELAELKQEVWYQGDGSSDEEGDSDWFYVDDDGEIHDV